MQNAGIAQLVERNLAKVEVESSRLFSRSKFQKREASASLFCQGSGFWRGSKAVMPRIANPVSPVRLRTAPPDTVCNGKVTKPSGQRRKQRSFQGLVVG